MFATWFRYWRVWRYHLEYCKARKTLVWAKHRAEVLERMGR